MTFDSERTAGRLVVDAPDLPTVTVPPTADLASATAIVKCSVRHHELTFNHGDKTGPILRHAVSPEMLDRARSLR